jgi:dienelactone hydrolase
VQARRRQRGRRARRRILALSAVGVASLVLALSLTHRHTGSAVASTGEVVPPSADPAVAPQPLTPAASAASVEATPSAAAETPPSPAEQAADPAPDLIDEAAADDAPDWAPSVTNVRFAIEREVRTFSDPSRPTPARGDAPGYDGRTLRTLVERPVGAAGPLPLVVFAHGYDSEPEVYERLLDAWAGAGYLVAAPEMPGSARDFPGEPTEGDIGEQARDLSFVITAVLEGDMNADPNEIAVAGHSDGGSTVATLALNDDFSDPRIDAYLVLSGGIPDDVDGSWGTTAGSGPMLVTVGQNDEYGDVPDANKVYNLGAMPKGYLLVPGGDHLNLYIGTSAVDESMRATTVGFLDGVLRRDGDALGSLHLTRQSGLVHS